MLRRFAKNLDKVRGVVSQKLQEPVEHRNYSKVDPYTDKVRTLVASGRGGDGNSSFMHVFAQNFAGPGGGNGGAGGSIYVVGNHKREDLLHIERMGFHIAAETGRIGGTIKRHGKNGTNMVLDVPVGTVIIDVDTNQTVHDVHDEEGFLLLEGGKGGRGNASFAHSTNQSPVEFTKGLPGTSMLVQFELKSMNDVGLIGYPNAGKSAVLCALTRAQPAVTEWSFSTNRPNVGYLNNPYGERVSLIDIPSLVDGAFLNRGVGHQFLRHVERSIGLVYVIDMTCASNEGAGCSKSPLEVLKTLQRELEFYEEGSSNKGFMVLANKMDCEVDVNGRSTVESLLDLQNGTDLPVFPVSAEGSRAEGFHAEGTGMREAVTYLYNTMLRKKRAIQKEKDEERNERTRQRDKLYADKTKWLRAGSETDDRFSDDRPVSDKNTVRIRSRMAHPASRGVEFSLQREIPHDEMGENGHSNVDDNPSLVDQQLDPYFGFSGVTPMNVHSRQFASEQNPLVYRDQTFQGRAWKLTREENEVLTDEVLSHPLPGKE